MEKLNLRESVAVKLLPSATVYSSLSSSCFAVLDPVLSLTSSVKYASWVASLTWWQYSTGANTVTKDTLVYAS